MAGPWVHPGKGLPRDRWLPGEGGGPFPPPVGEGGETLENGGGDGGREDGGREEEDEVSYPHIAKNMYLG